MGRFRHEHNSSNHDDSDLVSELSHDDSTHSSTSKSSGFRNRLGRFGHNFRGSDGTASVGSKSSSQQSATSERRPAAPATSSAVAPRGSTRRNPTDGARLTAAGRAGSADGKTDRKRLAKDAKSRFNIGLVYLKTGDYAKAQKSLEHALFCHIKLSGHDSATYANETILAVAGVREKLGDCYVASTAIECSRQALDHYEESRRLLRSVSPEDAPPDLAEMLRRVEEKMEQPELRGAAARKPTIPRTKRSSMTTRYQMEGNDKAKALLGLGADTGARRTASAAAPTAGTTKHRTRKARAHRDTVNGFDLIGGGFERGFGKLHQFAQNVKEGIDEVAEDLGIKSDSSGDEDSQEESRSQKSGQFDMAMAQLEQGNHRTALKTLQSLKEGQGVENEHFRREMADSMLKVAEGASEAKKVAVAVDAYEGAHKILARDDAADGEKKQLALKGCIRCNKQLAMEMEGVRSYINAIECRTRVVQLLDENDRTVPACEQRIIIAHHRATREEYDKSSAALSDAARRLKRGAESTDAMTSDRRDLLITCHQMQAICFAKSKKWKEALEQYDEVLPLISKREGRGGKEYNSALIHKSALLVTMGDHRLAASSLDKYMTLADLSDPNLIVDDVDHILALDTLAAAQLKLGNANKSIPIFERKLAHLKTLPDNPDNKQMKSDTMHKLGCLLANKKQPKRALPLLNQALSAKKYVYDGEHKSVLETAWAVAATNQSLGENRKALEEYTMLLDKMANVVEAPVDTVIVHNSASKLFFEEGKVDKAIQSFDAALKGAETLGDLELKSEIILNMANALSARGEEENAMDLYDQLLNMKSLKKTRIAFLARFNKCLLLIKMGEVEKAKGILNKIAGNSSPMADGVKGSTFLTLGNLAISDGDIDRALECFEKSLEVVDVDDLGALVDAKRSIAMAELETGKTDDAIAALEEALEDVSKSNNEGKSMNLLKAEIWNCMARVYKKKGELARAKNFAKLALQMHKTELGETNPIALRDKSNLQLILLEEAEDLEKAEAKPIIDAVKFELEETLEAFVSLDDPWTYRFDVASLKINLGFIAIWQGKAKKARKLVRQVKEIELPPDHPLGHRITVLGERVEEMEKKKKS